MKNRSLLFAVIAIILANTVKYCIGAENQDTNSDQQSILTPIIETDYSIYPLRDTFDTTDRIQMVISNTHPTASKQSAATKVEDKNRKQAIGVDIGIVTGIMYVDGTPLAVIDGVILREGQSIRQVKVVKINSDSVEFEYDGTRWSQQVNKPRSNLCIGTINSRMLSNNMSVEDISKYVSPSVVKIVVYDNTGAEFAFGSGFFIGNGKILTNAHVVEGAYSAEVFSLIKNYKDVTIIKRDNDLDLAILEVQSVGEPIILFADDINLRVGQKVLAIGNPEGLERTVSDGMISAIRNQDGVQYIQITAPISGGSSGGPLLNLQGLVIGVTFAGLNEGQNLNFAVSIETIKRFLRTPDGPEQLKEAGTIEPGSSIKAFCKLVKITVISIAALAVFVTFILYILKRFNRRLTIPSLRKKRPDTVIPRQESYQPVFLSSQKSDRDWRGL